MLRREIWLWFGLVCTAHLFLLQGFLRAGGDGGLGNGNPNRFVIQVIDRTVPATNVEPILAVSTAEVKVIPASKVIAPKPVPTEEIGSTQKPLRANPDNTSSLNFNRDRFLNFEALDEAAIGTVEFESALNKALPRAFDKVVLEFLIDEHGAVVQLSCIEGDCSAALDDDIQPLLRVPFTPALKNGLPVASRKVLQISPAPAPSF